MARLFLSPGYQATAGRLGVSAEVFLRITETIETLLDAWPNLPGPEHDRFPRPPTGQCWRRRVPGTSLAVLYVIDRQGVSVLAVKSGP